MGLDVRKHVMEVHELAIFFRPSTLAPLGAFIALLLFSLVFLGPIVLEMASKMCSQGIPKLLENTKTDLQLDKQ